MMKVSIFVFTTDITFGELLRRILEETGRYSVRVTVQNDAALDSINQADYSLAFLDASQSEGEAVSIGSALRQAHPQIKIIIVSESDPSPTLKELAPDSFLPKPFYMPDMLEMMENLLSTDQVTTTLPEVTDTLVGSTASSELSWLDDADRSAQHLTRLTLETSAQAALLIRNNELWAYAGQLLQTASSELTGIISRYWDQEGENDLMRFARLATTGAEHMLYATHVDEENVLVLVFDASTPFNAIHKQADHFVHSLSANLKEEENTHTVEEEIVPINDILSNVPPPNPQKKIQTSSDNLSVEPSTEFQLPHVDSPEYSFETLPALVKNSLSYIDHPKPGKKESDLVETDIAETISSGILTHEQEAATTKANPIADQEVTPEAGRKIVLEPISPAVYNLNYACLLIPRFTHHHLAGELASYLSEWVPQICVAFGWRLEHIAIRPDYLHWIVSVPPATSPSYVISCLRQHSSEMIFKEFSRYKIDNPSGDFWAPGYLIMGGSQSPPAQLIKDFIQQIRYRQGFSQPLR